MQTLGIIMAKSGSQRAPNKNIADICGKPLMSYAIDALKDSGVCDRIIVSTDSYDYGKIGVESGADEYVLREPWSDKYSQMSVTADEARSKYERVAGEKYDNLVVCGANIIFLRPSWLRAAMDIMLKYAYKSMPIDVVGMEPYHWGVNVCRVWRGIMRAPHFYVFKHYGMLLEIDWPHELELARQLASANRNGAIEYPDNETIHEDVIAKREQVTNRMGELVPLEELLECKTMPTYGPREWC